MTVSGIPGVDDILSSHEQEIHPSTSLAEDYIKFEVQTDQNYNIGLRQTYLALKLKFVQNHGYETYQYKHIQQEHKEMAKTDQKTEEEQVPIPLVTHVNSILHSIFSHVEVYINCPQYYKSNWFFAQNSYLSNNFKGAISDYKGNLTCEGYDYEQYPAEIMEAPLSEPIFTLRMKLLSRHDGFMLYDLKEVDFFFILNCYFQIWKLGYN